MKSLYMISSWRMSGSDMLGRIFEELKILYGVIGWIAIKWKG